MFVFISGLLVMVTSPKENHSFYHRGVPFFNSFCVYVITYRYSFTVGNRDGLKVWSLSVLKGSFQLEKVNCNLLRDYVFFSPLKVNLNIVFWGWKIHLM